ncbi:MAG: geranylgeranyl reductase [Candidatus Diapherotrites archaeon CG10_big_fil_rev_8_21_14_0_10_31_34]|nr:MAG: geranylgeranyl reductase [Candidatus Diapherotrites archaeon CG10_big_fil_rev_8_21_14_0_10_31_34]
MTEEFDVIVVGAGPGGSTCASFLAKNKVNVLLLDKAVFPRDKTCGDGISGKSLKVLKELGLKEKIKSVKHGKIFGVTFSSPKGTVVNIPFPEKAGKTGVSSKGEGYAVKRIFYDNFLFQNSKSFGVKTIEGFTVNSLIKDGEKVLGVKGTDSKGNQKEFKSKMVVGADGATSIVSKSLGLNKIDFNHHITALRTYYSGVKDLKGTIEIHFIDSMLPGYFWIFPVEEGIANVGAGIITKDLKKNKVNLQQAMFDAIEKDPLFKERFKDAKMVSPVKGWTLPLGSKRKKISGNGFLLVGDAASLIDPFSGEGIGNAMTSGKIASETILKALKENNFSAEFLKQYEEILWKEIGQEIKTSFMLQRLGRIRFLLNFLIDKAAKKKEIQEVISGMLANEEAKKEFVSPLFYLKLLFT